MKKSLKTLPYHITDFLEWLEIEKGLADKSQENYARFIKRFIDWLKRNNLQELKPHQLASRHIWKYRAYLARQHSSDQKTSQKTKNLKKSTQNCYLIALRALLNYFADRDILALPAEKIKLPKGKDTRMVNFLNLEQLSKLFSAPDVSKTAGLRDRSILETLFSTGMRIAELTALNREQIQTDKEAKNLELSIIGKGGKVRTVYLSERTIHWLKKYIRSREDKEKALFINYRSKTGSPPRLTQRAIQRSIKKYAVMAGLPFTITPHAIRHSFATDLLNQGVDLRTLQEFLGHKSPAATQIYTHVTNQRLRDIHQKFHGGRRLQA